MAPYQQMNEGVVKAFTTRQYSRATSRSSPIGPSTGCSFINKTRIKTNPPSLQRIHRGSLQDHIPTKQGLRLRSIRHQRRPFISTRPYPNKTRMKKCPMDISTVRLSESAEQNTLDFQIFFPTKQGLRHTFLM